MSAEVKHTRYHYMIHLSLVDPGASLTTGAPFLARSDCTEGGPGTGTGPGTGRMGYYILCCTVHTALGPGTGNCTMGCGPIFPFSVPDLCPGDAF